MPKIVRAPINPPPGKGAKNQCVNCYTTSVLVEGDTYTAEYKDRWDCYWFRAKCPKCGYPQLYDHSFLYDTLWSFRERLRVALGR